ncbi:MAG: FG-GAP repeat protein [Chitinophagaceae bacterium]|nr:FG-GAP repeat protein [Chitinophagaceae bacterium]
MTKLLPLITGIVLLTLFLRFNNKQNNDPVLPAKSNFLLNEKYGAGITETKKPHSATDVASLQQSSWYASAVSSISQQEYHFNYDERLHAYSTPNRKNNLRFYYDQYGFTAEPRTTLVAVDKDATGRHPGKKKIRYQPGWKVAFKLDTAQLGNGCWKVAGNTAEYNTGKIAVQYINSEEGMRQNFIVAAPLQSTNELKINFSIKTTLKTVLQNNQIQFFHHKAGNVLNYSDLKVWDANGKMLAANFGNNNNDYCINVDTKNASYPIIIDPISSTPAAVLESNQAAANMGCAVASAGDVNGDGYSDVLVGAYLYDNGQTDEGRVFIYHGSSAGISATPAVTLESNQANSKFGYSVATAGDVNGDGYSDIIVGAYFYDNGQTDEGAAFVYRGSATGINSTVFTTLESNQASASFGISVACAGDVNGDGFSDVIVGANGYDNGQINEGAAFVSRCCKRH